MKIRFYISNLSVSYQFWFSDHHHADYYLFLLYSLVHYSEDMWFLTSNLQTKITYLSIDFIKFVYTRFLLILTNYYVLDKTLKSLYHYLWNSKNGNMKQKIIRWAQSDSFFPGQYIILVGMRRKKKWEREHFFSLKTFNF